MLIDSIHENQLDYLPNMNSLLVTLKEDYDIEHIVAHSGVLLLLPAPQPSPKDKVHLGIIMINDKISITSNDGIPVNVELPDPILDIFKQIRDIYTLYSTAYKTKVMVAYLNGAEIEISTNGKEWTPVLTNSSSPSPIWNWGERLFRIKE